MNLRTADRLRLAIRIFTLLIAVMALWIAVISGFRTNRVADRLLSVENTNKKQTRALYVLADGIDTLQRLEWERLHPNEPLPKRPANPYLPPELDPTFQNNLKLEGRFDPNDKNPF